MRENVNATSSAVNAEPSDHFTPCFSFQVTVRRSADTPPFATVGISAARPFASGFASGPYDASGSVTSRAASLSLVPVARCALRIVGACQYRIFRSSPAPRFDATVADAPGVLEAAGGVVPQAASVIAATATTAAARRHWLVIPCFVPPTPSQQSRIAELPAMFRRLQSYPFSSKAVRSGA